MDRWSGSIRWTLGVLCAVLLRCLVFGGVEVEAGYSVETINSIGSVPQAAPKIKVEIGKGWENVTGRVGAGPDGVVQSVFSEKGDDLLLSCSAGYPVRWNITGIITPPEIVKIQSPKRNLKKNTFQVDLNIFFLDAENYTELAASSRIACEEIGNYKNRDEIAVFVKGNTGRSLISPEVSRLEGDITVIPCPTTTPTGPSKPSLYFQSGPDQRENLVENVAYFPTEGFRNAGDKAFPGGIYICKLDAQSVTFTVISSLSYGDAQFAPVFENIRRFSDESIEFSCSSKTKPVTLVFHNASNDAIITNVVDTDKSKVRTVAMAKSSKLGSLQGKAACIFEEGKQLIKEWSWEFLQPPQLYLDNLEGEADCLSTLTPKIVQTVRCKNSMDCDFMGDRCLGNVSRCNFKKQKQFFADVETYCWVEELQKGRPCVSVPFSHLNGVVKCGVQGLERTWEFFISLDYKRYSNWKEAPLRELVKIEEVSEDLDTSSGANTKLVCTATAYLFADSLAFEIQYKNGSKELLQPEVPSQPLKMGAKPILELNVKATLERAKISPEAVSVDCLAPFWNGTEVLRVSKLVGGGGRRMAAMEQKQGEPTMLKVSIVEEDEVEFHIGEEGKRLNCTVGEGIEASGFPVPTWIYREKGKEGAFKNATQVFPALTTGVDPDTGIHYLEFEKVEKKHGGDYQCVILGADANINGENTVLTKYKLDVSAEPLPTSTTVYVGITVLVLVIVGLAIAGYAIMVQKRNNR